MSTTVILLPETRDNIICLRLRGTVTAPDYKDVFAAVVEDVCARYDWYNIYVDHDSSFRGWEPEAADLSFRCISTYGGKARRMAYTNPPDSLHLLMKMLEPLHTCETRFFDAGEEAVALAWVHQDIHI
ncbi:MAG: STAS/SEC14 domain-containing protein [Alphaproteobacteria bacterium]|nr:STAS/SEC14 domain-containing protein [Alphaproteobacteria bacterium]